MSENKSRYLNLINAVDEERKQEEQFFRDVLLAKSVKQKVDLGFAWYPCRINAKYYTIGEMVEIELERIRDTQLNHKLKVGLGIRLTTNQKEREIEYFGTISFLRRNKIKLLLRADVISKDALPDQLNYIVEMVYDERPYAVMKDALNQVIALKEGNMMKIRNGIAAQALLDEELDYTMLGQYPHLNPSQLQAIEHSLKASQLSIIHGPPGTGKTTTLVALIKELSKREKRILVCASSNNAVDLLTHQLDAVGLNVLRIGNVSRIDDEVSHLTIDEKARNHSEWQRIKKIKIEAEEAQRMAGQFKRAFGQEQRDERRDMRLEAKELRKWAKTLEERVVSEIVTDAQVILSTLIGSANGAIDGLTFETVVIDEASQCLEPECWVAMLKAQKVIFAGDHKQLPPTVKSKEAMALGLDKTILDHMADFCKFSNLLNVQYRMNDAILHFPNIQFYNGRLQSSPSCATRTIPNDSKPVVYIDTAGTGFEEMFNPEYRSLWNEGEFLIIREHILQSKENLLGMEIGIITPYAEQVRYINSQLQDDEELRSLGVKVDTIDGFQGQEKDVIYISLVRSNDRKEIGFLIDERRLNVALTRAKRKLVIVGDSATIGNYPIYVSMLNEMEKVGYYGSAWEYMLG
jgi:ATP-dependent RNA/DNA helicase IGHMBP2